MACDASSVGIFLKAIKQALVVASMGGAQAAPS